MAISKIEQAIIDSIDADNASRIDASDIASLPLNMILNNTLSMEIIAASSESRMVNMGNIGVITAFLSVDNDAVADAGIPSFGMQLLPQFELPAGHSLNGITKTGPTTMAFQTFGPV